MIVPRIAPLFVRCLTMLCAYAALFSAPALAAESGGEKAIKNSIGMTLVRVEPGRFVMGSPGGPPHTLAEFGLREYDEVPAHTVTISRPFYLGATEVTNSQFEVYAPEHRAVRSGRELAPGDRDPLVDVTWQQAVDFCRWLSEREGRPYRLPTEAEWEYACRAGSTSVFSTGDRLTAAAANVGITKEGRSWPRPVAVGSYAPNAWGLFDMHGNAAEWCLDWYGPYEAGAQTDPVGRAAGLARVARGGSYLGEPYAPYVGNGRSCRAANRGGVLPDDANCTVGFRVVQAELPATKPLPVAEPPLCMQRVLQTPARGAAVDSTKPHFDDFKAGDRRPKIAADAWGPVFSAHNHYSTVCVCPNGDVLAAWYTTKSEKGRELAQAAARLRAGSDRWDDASSFLDIPDMNDHAPVLLAHGQRLYHFFGQGLRKWDDAAIALRTSDDSGATWTPPRIIWSRAEKVQLSQPCSALVRNDGALVVAIDGDSHRQERLLVSRDEGKSWQLSEGDLRQACGDQYVIHPAMTELDEGALLIFLRGPSPMPALLTRDLGRTFTLRKTALSGIDSGEKAAVLRLASGAHLLLSADHGGRLFGSTTYVALSRDGGQTWPHYRKLDSVSGYMSLAQAPGGTIYAFGSRMSVAAFNEAWVAEGKPLKK